MRVNIKAIPTYVVRNNITALSSLYYIHNVPCFVIFDTVKMQNAISR
jgi:hypothetical protein